MHVILKMLTKLELTKKKLFFHKIRLMDFKRLLKNVITYNFFKKNNH